MIKANKNIELDDSAPDRVNAFSDGVFAIIITIMILELKKPESNLWRIIPALANVAELCC